MKTARGGAVLVVVNTYALVSLQTGCELRMKCPPPAQPAAGMTLTTNLQLTHTTTYMQHFLSYGLAVAVFAAGVTAGSIGFTAAPAIASTVQSFTASVIENADSENALSIVQTEDVGRSRSRSGALFLDNTGNDNTGFTLYTDAGATAAQPLMRMEVDNPAWEEEILYIHSDSPTSRGLIRLDSPAPEIEFVETDQPGAAGKFEVRVQHDTFQINSRRADDTTFENKISMTHDGDLVLADGSVEARGINLTGGCIAIDGECVLSAGDDVSDISTPTDTTREAPQPISGVTLSNGAPDPIGCNSYTERGAMTLDHETNRLYICNGPERGWDYTDLHD